MNLRKTVELLKLFLKAVKDFSKNDPLILGSSTAFFTLFALPAIFFILLNILGIVFNPEIVSGQLFKQLSAMFGAEVARQVRIILSYFQDMERNWKFLIAGSVFFFLVSTTLFIVIEKSINRIWNIMPRPKSRFISIMKKRSLALVVIFIGGLLVLFTIVADTLIDLLFNFLPDVTLAVDPFLILVANRIVVLAMVTLWFALLFKLMPDAKIKWKVAWTGSFITAVLFTAGKILLGYFFIDELGKIYGPASAVVLLLIFIFYVSCLIYYGASFTKAYATYIGEEVKPARYAVKFKTTLCEDENQNCL